MRATAINLRSAEGVPLAKSPLKPMLSAIWKLEMTHRSICLPDLPSGPAVFVPVMSGNDLFADESSKLNLNGRSLAGCPDPENSGARKRQVKKRPL